MSQSGKITLSEIAKRAETSTMAVSVVLNGAQSNTRVSEATRQRILAIAAELKYSPNAMARSLKRQRTNTIGVLFNWAGPRTIHNLFSMTVLDGVVAGAASAGYHVMLYTESWKNASISAASFSDRRADGILVVAPSDASDVVPTLVALKVPIAVFSASTKVEGVPYVNLDNRQGVALALEHLNALGHTRIAYVGQDPKRYSMRERYDAYRAWMNQNDLPVWEAYIEANVNMADKDTRLGQIQSLFRLSEPPTAVFAATDDLAAEVLEAARNSGTSVPEQLSVVGFDDVLVASLTVPKLTTVRQPLYEMGQQAAWMLIERIEEKGEVAKIATCHITIPELIVRESTASPSPLPTLS